jgi:uncharacterized protein YunC (DUF1805 family)
MGLAKRKRNRRSGEERGNTVREIEGDNVEFDGRKYLALKQHIGNLPLIVVKAKNGYVACSYIDRQTAEKVGDIAAFVSGVKNVDDFKKAKIRQVTTWAENIGVREGMSVKKALELMDTFSE